MTGTRMREATLPRELVGCVFNPLRLLRLVVRYEPRVIRGSFTERKAITHRIEVRRHAAQKRSALAAHHAQWQGERAGLPAWPGSCWRCQSRCSGSASGENGSLIRVRRQEPCDATFWRLADMIPPVRI